MKEKTLRERQEDVICFIFT